MSGEALYERYKDALKRGHVASLRGRLDEALAAYGEAAAIAPERSTPYTSAGTALLRRKRAADAVRQFELALRVAPRDEAAMLGRAQALAALDRRLDAANTFDALVDLRLASGKLADAVDAARRGLEMAEGRDRRRSLERLITRLRASEPGEPGRLALERALRVLDGPAVAAVSAAPTEPASAVPSIHVEPGAAGGEPPAESIHATAGEPPLPGDAAGTADALSAAGGPEGPDAAAGNPVTADDAAEAPGADEAVLAVTEAPVLPVRRRALDRDLPSDAGPASLEDAAELALVAADFSLAREHLLDLAAWYRREGLLDASLDACYQALSVDPDDVSLHLALVELYDARGLDVLAEEKLDLMTGLAELDGDAEAIGRIALTRSGRA